MHIVIKPHQKIGDSFKNDVLAPLAEWLFQKLIPSDFLDKISKISIRFEQSDTSSGFLWETYNKNTGKYNFRIVLDPREGLLTTLMTLCHEFVHIKQKVTEELWYDDKTSNWCWKRKKFGASPYQFNDEDVKLPWEREAIRSEKKLVVEFLEKALTDTGRSTILTTLNNQSGL